MGKSEGEVGFVALLTLLPCPFCGVSRSSEGVMIHDNAADGSRCVGHRREHERQPIHPARLAAEGLVPAASLVELVEALEWSLGRCDDNALTNPRYDEAEKALANARKFPKEPTK